MQALYFIDIVGTAPMFNGIATVTVNGLECGVTYTITAGGTLNGDLVGPRSSQGNITVGPCPMCPVPGTHLHTTVIEGNLSLTVRNITFYTFTQLSC